MEAFLEAFLQPFCSLKGIYPWVGTFSSLFFLIGSSCLWAGSEHEHVDPEVSPNLSQELHVG